MIRNLTLFLLSALLLVSCNENKTVPIAPNIIPKPISQTINNGTFLLTNKTSLSFDSKLVGIKNYCDNYLKNIGISLQNETNNNSKIVFSVDATIKNEEGYKLTIAEKEITVKAKNTRGAFYGFQTLTQLLPIKKVTGNVAVQCLSIKDAPKFKYRGMHLDVGRHFFSVDFIKKYIDVLATLKMNTFHWHLTEDQGWRIEIKKYPKLQEVAAYRDETLIGHYSDQPHKFDGKRYGGYYTQEQVKDVVAYAQERQVTIIPEIELPGHSQAAIAAYPHLGCTGEPIKVATKWGIFNDIYCPKEETFKFLEDVLDEVMQLFPSKYIHIGGDEAPKKNWKESEFCQELIKKEGLKDEHELQSYFITRIEKYINSKGRQIIGWDEILEGGLAPNATVMSWRGIKGAVTAAKQKHDVILTPGSHCYFDHYQSEDENEPLAIGGFTSLEKAYSFNPIPEELTKEEHKYVLGAQGNVWTEYMKTSRKVEYMAFPRAIALSEVVWSYPTNRSFDDFVTRLQPFLKRLDAMDIKYANHLYNILGNQIVEDGKIEYELKSPMKSATIHYTTNGEKPTEKSEKYTAPIKVDKNSIIKAMTFEGNKPKGALFTKKIIMHKAVGKTINIEPKPHKNYDSGGEQAIINGTNGNNKRYGDNDWLGFWGDDIAITIDLGKVTQVNKISTRFHNGNGQWIYAPKGMEIVFDKNSWKEDFTPTKDLLQNVSFNTVGKTRFIELKIPSYGIIPEGKQGAGNKAWTFIDEIIVE